MSYEFVDKYGDRLSEVSEREGDTEVIFRSDNDKKIIRSLDSSDVKIRRNLIVKFIGDVVVIKWKLPPNCTIIIRERDFVGHTREIDWNSVNIIQITNLYDYYKYGHRSRSHEIPANYIKCFRDNSTMYIKNDVCNLGKVFDKNLCMFIKCLHVRDLRRYIPKPILWKIVTYYL